MKCWIVKSDTADYSIEMFRNDKVAIWDGVRNFQARNYLMAMEPGDQVLFYQSVTEPVGVAGLAEVRKKAMPDPTQFDRKSKYYDMRATTEKPVWFCPELVFKKEFPRVIGLAELRAVKGLTETVLLKRGNRLSVMPLSDREYKLIMGLAG